MRSWEGVGGWMRDPGQDRRGISGWVWRAEKCVVAPVEECGIEG